MNYLIKNKYWDIVEDYNLDKLLYLLIDRPDLINRYNDFFWLNNKDQKHRNYDLPAVEYSNGDKFWYLNGKLHRENGPAVEYSNGTKFWYLNGKLHREDNKPSYVSINGYKKFRTNDKLIKYQYLEKL